MEHNSIYPFTRGVNRLRFNLDKDQNWLRQQFDGQQWYEFSNKEEISISPFNLDKDLQILFPFIKNG